MDADMSTLQKMEAFDHQEDCYQFQVIEVERWNIGDQTPKNSLPNERERPIPQSRRPLNVQGSWRNTPDYPLGQGRGYEPLSKSTAQRMRDRLELVPQTLPGILNHMMV